MADSPAAYAALEARFARIAALNDAAAILSWDRQTVMPPGAAAGRADQLATLSVLAHRELTAPELDDLLAAAADGAPLDDWQRANLAEMRRLRVHATAVPPDLVEALSRAESACEAAWREARPAADFARVAAPLEALLGLVREAAALKAARLAVTPYEALLDAYDPGLRAARIDALFAELAAFLPDLVERALARQVALPPAPPLPAGPHPAARQRALAERLMQAAGFDFAHGRLDESRHPFCGGAADDVRITTRYDEADALQAAMAVLHETGHALYEQHLPARWRGQPVGRARGMTLHESQSLIVEMQAARTPELIGFLAPLLAETLGGAGWTAAALTRRLVHVERSLIRVEADEATYPLHVVLRYRLERALLAGELAVADLPGAWTEGMRALLGVAPPDDRTGCLQDIHWYDGAFGYFPTYTLGALAAAQFFAAACRDVPDIRPALARGDFAPLTAWLAERVHGRASLLPTEALIEQATGEPLSTAAFRRHLEARYLA